MQRSDIVSTASQSTRFHHCADEGEGYAGTGSGRRLGGADSPEFRDSMGHAVVNLIERAMASSDMHNLISDD